MHLIIKLYHTLHLYFEKVGGGFVAPSLFHALLVNFL